MKFATMGGKSALDRLGGRFLAVAIFYTFYYTM